MTRKSPLPCRKLPLLSRVRQLAEQDMIIHIINPNIVLTYCKGGIIKEKPFTLWQKQLKKRKKRQKILTVPITHGSLLEYFS